jgi:membrane-associated phospholipid phosphatase
MPQEDKKQDKNKDANSDEADQDSWQDSWFRAMAARYRVAYARPGYALSVVSSIGAFALSLVASGFAVGFATERASNPVTDLILSNIPVYDVDGIYVYGIIAIVAFIALLCIAHPKRVPFTLYSLALFFVIRSMFVTLTHLGPFSPSTPIDFGTTIQKMFFGDDYFFSGHTGSPFLMALVYWHEKNLRAIFLGLSVFFGAIVLMGHLHYSIDVFGAFFITYTIYHLALYFFPKSHALFVEDDPVEAKRV